jgi:hypothetical protein
MTFINPTPLKPHPLSKGSQFIIDCASDFLATKEPNPEGVQGAITDSDLIKGTLIESLGPDKEGNISFEIAVGEAWKDAVIKTNIRADEYDRMTDTSVARTLFYCGLHAHRKPLYSSTPRPLN